jgi:localization factor PodJL
MRAELPWNVAGIPPEAREAARAAARREGLSVGEWLTRRILRSFSDLGDEMGSGPAPFSAPSQGYGSAALDSWGLPQSSASRRDSEEMLARVSRSESESTESWRRIEEQLRGVGRRLDSSERSQSENNRVLSRTAAEMNVAAREQAQVFDQVSQTILAIHERLERLERDRASDGIKDAVKALHQGLSRLADQIGQTASHSAAQVTSVTQTIDQLAYKLGQARDDAQAGDREISERLTQVDGRAANAEKTVQFTTNALDHALEKLEAQAQQRANDQVEWQRRAGQTEESLQRLEDSVLRLERSGDDPTMERRLDGIESSLHGLVARLESYNPAAPLEETTNAIARRMDAMERHHADLVNEMRANIMAAPMAKAAPAEPAFDPHAFDRSPAFEAPPLAEPPPERDTGAGAFLPPYGTDTFAPEAFATGEFIETPDNESEDPFAPLNGMVEDAGGEENFLAAARRSAREAAEKSAAEKKVRFWSRSTATQGGGKTRLLPALAAMAVVAALAVAVAVVTIRLHHAPPAAPAAPPAANGGQPFTAAPQVGTTEAQPGQQQPAAATPNLENGPPPSNVPQPVKPQASAAQPPRAAPHAGPPTLERVLQLANTGNPIAQTIIGIRAQGGANGAAANPAEAFKWLSLAAAQGQPVAQYRLGTLYERGQGVAANPATAASWYEKAANAGNRLAMYNLAVALANKSLGRQNMPEAARWFSRAAAVGLQDAEFNLAVLYERGDGVPQSLLDAYKWYLIAATSGDSGAKARADVLATQIPDADRTAAQKSAQSFRPQPLNRASNVPPEVADLAGQ